MTSLEGSHIWSISTPCLVGGGVGGISGSTNALHCEQSILNGHIGTAHSNPPIEEG